MGIENGCWVLPLAGRGKPPKWRKIRVSLSVDGVVISGQSEALDMGTIGFWVRGNTEGRWVARENEMVVD